MGWPRPDFPANVEFGPQLACVTTDSARIVWRTLAPVRGAVEVRRPDGEWRAVPGAAEAARAHDIQLAGLGAASRVEYRILHDGRAAGDVHAFRMPSPAPFTFAVIGDSGSGGEGQYAVRSVMEEINPAFVLHVGDLAYDKGSRVEAIRRHFTPYRDLLATRPWYVAWGNHDVMTAGGVGLRKLFRMPPSTTEGDNRYYAFDWGELRVWALDFNMEWGKGSPQYDWFKRDLESSNARWKVVFGHYPSYSSSPYARSYRKRWEQSRAELCPLFEANCVALYFCGHTHGYERTFPIRDQKRVGRGEGTVHVVCGGGGKRLNRAGREEWTAVSGATLECMAIEVGVDSIVARAINANGKEFDRFTIPAPR